MLARQYYYFLKLADLRLFLHGSHPPTLLSGFSLQALINYPGLDMAMLTEVAAVLVLAPYIRTCLLSEFGVGNDTNPGVFPHPNSTS